MSTFEGIFGLQIDSEDQKFLWQKNTSDTLRHSVQNLTPLSVQEASKDIYT